MKRSGLRQFRSVLRRRQPALFLSWIAFSAAALVAAFWPTEQRALAELRVERATLAPGVSLLAPPIEARLETLSRRVLQETGSSPGVRILSSMRGDGRYVEVTASGEEPAEAAETSKRVASLLLARDLEDRREITRKALAEADSEATQAMAAERANKGAIELLRPQGLAEGAPVTSRTLAALATEAEGKVREETAALAEHESIVLGLETEVRLKRDQLLDESAAARRLADKGATRGTDGAPPLAKLPGWIAWRQACSRLEAAEQKLSAIRTKLARHQLELDRLHADAERWPERAQVLARLEAAQPGLKRAAEDAQARAEHAYRALEIELGKDVSKGKPEKLELLASQASSAPENPDRQLRLIVGLALALPLALAVALVRERLDRSLYEPEHWRDALGAPVLGRVPDLSEPGPGVGVR